MILLEPIPEKIVFVLKTKIFYKEMLKKFLIIHLTISLSQVLFCQQGWYQLNSGTSSNLRSIYFTDVNTGYVVGYSGTIIKTTNGGANWISYNGLTNENLYSVFFIGQTGFVVGGSFNVSSVILKTTNGGINWSSQPVAGIYGLSSIFMTDSATAYIAADWGKILKTTNGGNNWNILLNDNYTCYCSIYFTDFNTGFAVGVECIHAGGSFKRTNNGGSSWGSGSLPGYGRGPSLFFINSSTGYCANGEIYKTTNGGTNWTYQNLGASISSVYFTNETTGYTASYTGKIFKSTNTGTNWLEQTVSPNNQLYSIFFINSNTGYAAGNAGTILKTTNGGITAIEYLGNEIPNDYKLYQNEPNPFNPITKIRFDIASEGQTVLLTIYDILGRKIKTMVNEKLKPGTYEVDFEGSGYSSGIYFYTLQTAEYTMSKKMILSK